MSKTWSWRIEFFKDAMSIDGPHPIDQESVDLWRQVKGVTGTPDGGAIGPLDADPNDPYEPDFFQVYRKYT